MPSQGEEKNLLKGARIMRAGFGCCSMGEDRVQGRVVRGYSKEMEPVLNARYRRFKAWRRGHSKKKCSREEVQKTLTVEMIIIIIIIMVITNVFL